MWERLTELVDKSGKSGNGNGEGKPGDGNGEGVERVYPSPLRYGDSTTGACKANPYHSPVVIAFLKTHIFEMETILGTRVLASALPLHRDGPLLWHAPRSTANKMLLFDGVTNEDQSFIHKMWANKWSDDWYKWGGMYDVNYAN